MKNNMIGMIFGIIIVVAGVILLGWIFFGGFDKNSAVFNGENDGRDRAY